MNKKLRILQRVALGLLWTACIYATLELLVSASHWALDSGSQHAGICTKDDEGQWAIGIYKGPSPFSLRPPERWPRPQADTAAAWPVANPVYSCAHVTDVPSSFVADPFLWPADDGQLFMFYETKSVHNMQGDIGAAVSQDGGLSWRHQGVVLDTAWHLSYPFVFSHQGQMYLMPEGSKSGRLNLYSTTPTAFPGGWVHHQVMVPAPLIDASLIAPGVTPGLAPGVPGGDGPWFLLASNRQRRSSKGCRELEIWYSPGLQGPWLLHPASPVREGVQGSRPAGRPFVHQGKLYRLAQDCTRTYGHKLRVFQITSLNTTHFEDQEVELGFDPASGRQGEATWNSMRQHHMDAHQLASGEWIAAMDGDRYVSDYLTLRWLARLQVLLPVALLLACCTGWAFLAGGWAAAYGAPCTRLVRALGCVRLTQVLPTLVPQAVARRLLGPSPTRPRPGPGPGPGPGLGALGSFNEAEDGGLDKGSAAQAPEGGCSRLRCCLRRLDAALAQPSGLLLGLSGWRLLGLVGLLGGGAGLLLGLLWTFGRLQILSAILWYLHAAGGSPLPVTVQGQVSAFTILVMSYEARTITLKAFVQHYSQCSSVAAIVVVWNKGNPPDLARDLPSQVPVRVRVEGRNSMNNRFAPDPDIATRAVLMLDDDILMPCSDIERGFARWRQHPERITGYYARLLEGQVPQYLCTQCERHTYASGRYNVILAGASFLDQQLVLPAYSAPANKAGREYVDRVFNCDDLLLNYLMAATLQGRQYVEWVRPSKRFDVGRLTSKRLSTGSFGPVRHNCTRDFAALFNNPLVNRSYPLNFQGKPRPLCPTGIGCIFV